MSQLIHSSALGRIERTSNGRFESWDFRGEYLGPSDTEEEAREDLRVAKDVHDWLVDRYNNRHR